MSKLALTHLDATGSVAMVDVSAKPPMRRQAIAQAFISLQVLTLDLIRTDAVAKGNVLAVARIAGIQGAKRTWDLIPLCHQLPLSHVSVEFTFEPEGLQIRACVRTTAATGVEMEALTAVSLAALTIYDMCKAVDKTMIISAIHLLEKSKAEL